MSRDAYQNWDDNPILTTVSTTAFPIHALEYPAITICGQVLYCTVLYCTALYCTVLYCTVLYPDLTICGQGMATDTLDKVLKERFENWMRSRGLDLNSESVTITSLCYYLVFDLILKGTSKTQVN